MVYMSHKGKPTEYLCICCFIPDWLSEKEVWQLLKHVSQPPYYFNTYLWKVLMYLLDINLDVIVKKIPGLLMYLYCSVVMRKWNWTRSNHVQAFHLIGNHVNTSQVTGMPKKLTIISHNSIKIYAITNLLLFPNKKILSSLEGVKI